MSAGAARRTLVGRSVFPIGVGGAGWSLTDLPRAAAHDVLGAALDAGVDVVDTAYAYARVGEPRHNEQLVAEVLAGRAEAPLVVTKGGHYRTGETSWAIDGGAEALRADCLGSLAALGVDVIDLYLLHWPDPDVPLTESVRALRDLQQEGLVRGIGLSNVTLDQLDAAASITAIAAVENRFSAVDPGDGAVLRATGERGIAHLAYSPLGGGDLRADADLVRAAADLGQPLPRLLLAWLLRHAPHCIPLVGAGSRRSVDELVAAAALDLDEAGWDALERALPASPAA